MNDKLRLLIATADAALVAAIREQAETLGRNVELLAADSFRTCPRIELDLPESEPPKKQVFGRSPKYLGKGRRR